MYVYSTAIGINKNMTDKNMTNFLKIRQILAVIILATKVGINHILMIIKVNIILFSLIISRSLMLGPKTPDYY